MPLHIGHDGRAEFSSPADNLQMVGLARELKLAFGDAGLANEWMKRPCSYLDDRTPQQVLRDGRTAEVRARLEAHQAAERREQHEADKMQRMQTELR